MSFSIYTTCTCMLNLPEVDIEMIVYSFADYTTEKPFNYIKNCHKRTNVIANVWFSLV